ncbi:hypothetical protein BGZ49_010323 [Haplosporangium sp. Z 27]|nr:hypothetical protein BGZ49_010323 [Haplosporangium sp. Z 27]
MWTDYSTATLAQDPYACIPNSDRMAPSIGSLIPSVSYGIDNSGLMDMYVTGDDWDLVTPVDNGETLYKFRISAIPYQAGHGLLLQYSITDTIVFTAPCCNQSSLWTPSNCTTLLSTYGFVNTTAACHNATLGVDNYRIFIHTENGEYRHTMRYCVMYASGGFWVSANYGVRHIQIQYLGPLTATPGKTYEYSIQPQGSTNAWCGMTNGKYICDSNSTGQIFPMVSYRGYGSHRTYYEVENTPELHAQDMNTTVGLIEDLYLREYSIGTGDPIYHGVKAPGISYLTLSYFRADITVFIIAIALLVACIIAILVLHFRILPKYYTSSTLNVLRIATSLQGKRHMVKPGDADQIITVETTSIGTIILRNNGLSIGTTSNEYDLEATHSRFTSEDNLLSVVV